MIVECPTLPFYVFKYFFLFTFSCQKGTSQRLVSIVGLFFFISDLRYHESQKCLIADIPRETSGGRLFFLVVFFFFFFGGGGGGGGDGHLKAEY